MLHHCQHAQTSRSLLDSRWTRRTLPGTRLRASWAGEHGLGLELSLLPPGKQRQWR